MSKRFTTDADFRVCNNALQLHGGYGYIREYPLERHMRDMRVIIGRRLLMGGCYGDDPMNAPRPA